MEITKEGRDSSYDDSDIQSDSGYSLYIDYGFYDAEDSAG
ncbi:hypothetical protein K190097F3_05990 [Enterocloster clostridioformis]